MNTPTTPLPTTRDRFRIRFAKTGLLRWIGHRDLQRLWERLLRRAALPLSMSEGFHPKPRISFPSALALGAEGLDEVVEIELSAPMDARELRQRLVDDNQPGLAIGEVRHVARALPSGHADPTFPGLPKARLHSSRYEVEIPESFLDEVAPLARVEAAVESLRLAGVIPFARKDDADQRRSGLADLASNVPDLRLLGRTLRMTLLEASGTSLKPGDVLAALGLERLIEHGGILCRTRVILCDEQGDTDLEIDAPRGELAVASAAADMAHPSKTSFKERSS